MSDRWQQQPYERGGRQPRGPVVDTMFGKPEPEPEDLEPDDLNDSDDWSYEP